MRLPVIIAVIALFPYAVLAKQPVQDTWGKLGVSYDQYRNDSIDCAYVGYNRDISKDEPAVRFVTGWRAGDTALNMPGGNGDGWGAAIARTQPDRRRAEIHAIQTSDVENCLSERGYRKVGLTRLEIRRLGKLRAGSEARHRYLHSIATR